MPLIERLECQMQEWLQVNFVLIKEYAVEAIPPQAHNVEDNQILWTKIFKKQIVEVKDQVREYMPNNIHV